MNSDHVQVIREALSAHRKYINATHPTFDTERHKRVMAIDAALAALDENVALPVNEYQIEGGYGPLDRYSDTLKRQPQRKGPDKWAVYRNSNVLSREGYWEYEPLPSSRDDEFLARCRFDSAQEALAFHEECKRPPARG